MAPDLLLEPLKAIRMLKTKPKLVVYEDAPPQPLGKIGREVWDGVISDRADRDLNERERHLLWQAADAVERAADLAKHLDTDGMVIETSTGRKIEHPAVRPMLHFKALAVRTLMLLRTGPGSPGRPAGRWYDDRDDE